jgi:5-formyltetrahydrofolate cyclo-ligase
MLPDRSYGESMSDTAAHRSKAAVRSQLLARRRQRDPADDGHRLAQRVLALLDSPAATVCAYVATAGEPPTAELLDRLLAGGHRVLLPVLLDDLDLDWAAMTSGTALLPGGSGLLEPDGPRLGTDAVAGADLVVCPGLAADLGGVRLGRGGGSYDRALARTRARRVLLLHDDEVLESVPAQPHDQPVDVIVTSTRTLVCR